MQGKGQYSQKVVYGAREKAQSSQLTVHRRNGCCYDSVEKGAHRERGIEVSHAGKGRWRRGGGGATAGYSGEELWKVAIVSLRGMVYAMINFPGFLFPQRPL